MSTTSRERDRERLEQEIQTEEYQALLADLQIQVPFLRQFTTWADVILFMRTGSSQDQRKDEILRPIFRNHSDDRDPRWRTILTTIFWPALKSIHRKKRHWDDDTDDLWSNIVWTFLKVICRVDVQRRSDRLVQKVYCETVHHVYDEYLRIWKRGKREPALDSSEIEALAGAEDGIDLETIDLRMAHEREVKRLSRHLDEGRISEADFLLLLGTRLYGQSIAEYARSVDLNPETAKKRRQRAEAAIACHEKEMR